MGTSLSAIRRFPKEARRNTGDQLLLLQAEVVPKDWKPMPTVGSGVTEIRIHRPHEYRVLYVAKFFEAIYVLNAFEKKSRKTERQEIDKARRAYAKVIQERKKQKV
jgi:phage-related protein